MSLSVCLLTRNEEDTVGAAIRSVAEVADEILVVDTHSRDQTAARAAEAGARVLQYDWADDFGAGRNFTIAHATGDWIFWLNGTETVTPDSLAALREAVGQPNVFGYSVRVRMPLSATQPEQQSDMMDLRLFRRRQDLRFVGRAHPHFDASLAETVRREGLQVRPAAITIQGAPFVTPTESKLRWAAHLMELELQDRPGQLHYLVELGLTLLQLNDPRAQAVLGQAAELVFAAREAPSAPSVKAQALLAYIMTVAPEVAPACLPRDLARELALRWFPVSPHLMHLVAEDAFQRREFRSASTLLERLVMLGRTGTYDRSHAFDPELIGDRARANLAACYYNLGEPAKAEQCYRPLLANPRFRQLAEQGIAASQLAQQRRGGFSFSVNDLFTP
ncbi:MAG TPA: glycosyltransferase [Gemmataceae bacterium]|nr:glycosyltransferase [Gemmataceae bacterium]